MRNKRGFTFVEVMIVAAIVAVLAALALPAYGKYVLRSQRVEGQVLASNIAQAQERHFSTYNRYATSLTGSGLGNLGFTNGSCGLVASETCKYSATIATANSNQDFTVTLLPRLSQTTDVCGSLTLTGTGIKAFTGADTNGKCW